MAELVGVAAGGPLFPGVKGVHCLLCGEGGGFVVDRVPLEDPVWDCVTADAVVFGAKFARRSNEGAAISLTSLAIERSSSRTIATASRWNSSGYLDGRPVVLFLLDMDFLLYEVSAQRGDAQTLSPVEVRSCRWLWRVVTMSPMWA